MAPDDCFVVQYVHTNGAGSSVDPAAHAGSASLSIRYVGRPVLDAERVSVRSFEYAPALPAYISRVLNVRAATGPLSAQTVMVLGDGEREVEAVAPAVTAPASHTDE